MPALLAEITFLSYMVGDSFISGGLGSFEATMASLLRLLQVPAFPAITLLFRFLTLVCLAFESFVCRLWKRGEMGNGTGKKLKICAHCTYFAI